MIKQQEEIRKNNELIPKTRVVCVEGTAHNFPKVQPCLKRFLASRYEKVNNYTIGGSSRYCKNKPLIVCNINLVIKECNLKITASRITMINSYRENNNLPITLRIKRIKNVVGRNLIFIPRPDYDRPVENVKFSDHVEVGYIPKTDRDKGGASGEKIGHGGNVADRNLIFIPKPDYDRPVKNVRFSDHVEVRYIPRIDRNTDFSLGEKIGYGGNVADRNLIFIPKPDYDRPVKNVRFSDHVEVRYIPKTDRDTGFSLGEKIGSGGAANVYVNKLNPKEVIKIFNDEVPYKEVKHEVDCFCKCHGQGSASIIMSDNLPIGIAMKKIIGIPLNAMKYIPEKAKGKFEAMIEDMEVKGILHGDLTETNVLYNEKENEFKFVDITSYSKEYDMLKNSSDKFKLLESYALSRIYIINYVNSKIHQSGITKS
ncbi:OspG family effector kinase [Vibrio parahaemolyticus]|uniref:OspG family effector kinase n=1 Tax=Vibrio parahaemolyticus TaxID=670 RepID=UPI0011AF6A72|nr:hypothetical protein [Vibrio parahaemolyticus]